MWAGCLSKDQQVELAEAIFAKTDEHGFPADTGCLDSLILVLRQPKDVREKDLFSAKYLSNNSAIDTANYWENLRQTVVRFPTPTVTNPRSIPWNGAQLDKILGKAEEALPTIVAAFLSREEDDWMRSLFATITGGDSKKHMFHHWRRVIEDVVLLAPNAKPAHIDRGVALLDQANAAGLNTIDVKPTLVCLKQLSVSDAISSITHALMDRDETTVSLACNGIARWGELTRAEYKPTLPKALLVTLGTLIFERRHERLPLLLSAANHVVQTVGSSASGEFKNRLIQALEALTSETAYDSSTPSFSFATRIQLRASCVELAASLRKCMNVKHVSIQRWIEIGNDDVFSEVRRKLH